MVIVIDPQIAGISGDMLLSTLVSLGANKNKIIDGVKLTEKYRLYLGKHKRRKRKIFAEAWNFRKVREEVL